MENAFILNQILLTVLKRNVWRSVQRICVWTLGPKGFKQKGPYDLILTSAMKTRRRLHILSNFHAITPICPVTTALKRREIAGAEGREWQKNLLPCHSFSQVNIKCSHFTKQRYTRAKLLFCFLKLLCFRHFHCYSGIVSQGPL